MQESTKVLLDFSLLKEVGGAIRKTGYRFPWLAAKWLFYRVGNVVQEAKFDRVNNVNTGFIVASDELDFDDAAAQSEAVRYRPTPPFTIRRGLALLQRKTPIQFRDSTFIDYGCGAGRVLFIAAESGFARIIGLELSPALVDTCQANITNYARRRDCGEISVIRQNAMTYVPDGEVNVFFFFVPFGRDIYLEVMQRIRESLAVTPRTVYLLDIGSRLKGFSFADEGARLIGSVEKLSIFEYGPQ